MWIILLADYSKDLLVNHFNFWRDRETVEVVVKILISISRKFVFVNVCVNIPISTNLSHKYLMWYISQIDIVKTIRFEILKLAL